MFPSSTKREIRHFHIVVVQRRLRNVQKREHDTRAKLLFCQSKPIGFCRSRCRRRRRRRRCLSSLIFMSEDWDLGHQPSRPTPPARCLMCVNDLFQSCAVAVHTYLYWITSRVGTKSNPVLYEHTLIVRLGVPMLILEFLERSMQIALTKLLIIHHAIQLIAASPIGLLIA